MLGKPQGLEPATLRHVAQCLNHYATACHSYHYALFPVYHVTLCQELSQGTFSEVLNTLSLEPPIPLQFHLFNPTIDSSMKTVPVMTFAVVLLLRAKLSLPPPPQFYVSPAQRKRERSFLFFSVWERTCETKKSSELANSPESM
jgi:hypothetical protein